MRILVINGPSLNQLGKRQPELYGTESLWDVENRLRQRFPAIKLEFYQSNSEGGIIDSLQKASDGMTDGVVINPGAYAHSSYAIRDAIAGLNVPVVEVHISNIHSREKFRRISVTAAACKGVVTGFGTMGYELAVKFLSEQVTSR